MEECCPTSWFLATRTHSALYARLVTISSKVEQLAFPTTNAQRVKSVFLTPKMTPLVNVQNAQKQRQHVKMGGPLLQNVIFVPPISATQTEQLLHLWRRKNARAYANARVSIRE